MALHIVFTGDESEEVQDFHLAAIKAFFGAAAPVADKPAASSAKATGTKGKTKAETPPADDVKEDDVSSEEIRKVVKSRFPSEEDIDAVAELMEGYKVDSISDFDKKKPADRVAFLAELEALADKREAEAAKGKKRRSID